MERIDSWSRKKYLVLTPPSEEDNCPYQERILRELEPEFGKIHTELCVLRQLSAVCEQADWKITAVLSWDGKRWCLAGIEAGDTSRRNYGICADLGSTTIAVQILDMDTGEVLAEESGFNPQTAFGEDILTRIFCCKENAEKLEEIWQKTVEGFLGLFSRIEEKTGISPERDCTNLVISGNTTMIHFLYGLDPFPVFASPYAVRTLAPEIYPGRELGFPIRGYVYSYPARANYLGGDIISGMIATGIPFREELSVFLDIGTNGELVIGNKDFLISGAGAAGPAMEGGVVKYGMRAEEGAADRVKIENGEVKLHVLGGGEARGFCGSGIVDLLAQLFLAGWINMQGKLQPEASPLIREREGELCVVCGENLFFYQSDIDEFLKTKAAANTMVEYLMACIGLQMDEIERFYVSGAFGTHISRSSGITIGLYPDLPEERLILPGNTSLAGAGKMLLNRAYAKKTEEILDKMEYVQFGAVEDFLQIMVAAAAFPHTDYRRYPSVMEELARRGRPLE